MQANNAACFTKSKKEICNLFLCIIVTATRVEAEPMGVRFPPRLAPKITDHHNDEFGSVFKLLKIFANIAASGIFPLRNTYGAGDQQ